MTKKHGRLFEKIISRENLLVAFWRAAKNKHGRRAVKQVEGNLACFIDELHAALASGNYRTSPYATKTIYEPKERLIYILPFYPDRIVHHAIMNVLEPILDAKFYADSYACRKGKGQHDGLITKKQATSKIASAKGWLKHAQTRHFQTALRLEELQSEVNGYQ